MAETNKNNDLQKRIDFGVSLLTDKSEEFQKQAIIRFTEFDRLMALTNPDGNYHAIGYPTIVANLSGEFLAKEEDMERRKEETTAMMSKLGGLMGGFNG